MARMFVMLSMAVCMFAACADEVPVKDLRASQMHGIGVGIVLASLVAAVCGLMIVRWLVKRGRKDAGCVSSAA